MAFLRNHHLLSSNNLDEMRQILDDISSADEINLVGQNTEIDVTVNGTSFCDLDLAYVSYGNIKTQFKAFGENSDKHLFGLVTGGSGEFDYLGKTFQAGKGKGFIKDLRENISVYQDEISILALTCKTENIKRMAINIFGEEAGKYNVEFIEEVDFSSPEGVHVQNTFYYIANAIDGPLREQNNQIALNSLQDYLLSSIVTLLPNKHSEILINQPISQAVPFHVKRARDYIHAHASENITLETLVNEAGCSYRTLQRTFKSEYNMSPMAYLKFVRLAHIRMELLDSGHHLSIKQVAQKWGFIHMGRFAQDYLKQFGELPSQTSKALSGR